jgi:hypothetical protein
LRRRLPQGCTEVNISALKQRSALNFSDGDGKGEVFSAHSRSTINFDENDALHDVLCAFI